ncbi:hypothetical protein D9758_000290 [Tetrapyrgos nigripes]|uniref:Uncharacterized protein n=1 Tax=Tetrapyrgos nigripes TaxID=182062 RepID=A0A8H5LZ00_9AGAR|nr:hypothetical protein D9758_000290 [Tetrapyrgos nigripes]
MLLVWITSPAKEYELDLTAIMFVLSPTWILWDADLGWQSIEIFITNEDILKIAPDFGSLLVEDGGRHDESDTDPLWGLFNDLCIKELKHNRPSNKQPAFYISQKGTILERIQQRFMICTRCSKALSRVPGAYQDNKSWWSAISYLYYAEEASCKTAQDCMCKEVVEEEEFRCVCSRDVHTPLPKVGLGFGKKHSKWGLGMFGSDKSHHHDLPPVHDIPAASSSTGSLKRTQSAGSDSRSIRGEPSSLQEPMGQDEVKKFNKMEAERVRHEAEKQRRALAEKMQREQARAVMQKRNMIMQPKIHAKENIEWRGGSEQPRLEFTDTSIAKGKQAATGPIWREPTTHTNGNASGSLTANAASGRYVPSNEPSMSSSDWKRDERMTKVQRMDIDDDLTSVSSSDVHSTSRMSTISFATVDSDPGPSLFGLNRMTSTSSLRTSFDDFSPSRRSSSSSFDDFSPSVQSSNSFSLEGQLAHDFRTQASMDPHTPLTGSVSPPPMQMLSLSPSLSPSISPTPPPISPSPQWMQVPPRAETLSSRRGQAPPYINVPAKHPRSASYSPYDREGRPPRSGHVNKTDINPIFKVVSYKWDDMGGFKPDDISGKSIQPSLPTPISAETDESFSLPPFSHLDAVAREGGYGLPPLSPMSFTSPSEDALSP